MEHSSVRSAHPLSGKFFLQLEIYSRIRTQAFSQRPIKPLKMDWIAMVIYGIPFAL
jgi:hypothetical protein